MLPHSKQFFTFISGEWKTILLSLFLHGFVFMLIKTLPVPESNPAIPGEQNRYMELGQLPEQLKQFAENPEKPKPKPLEEKTKDIKGGVRPDKVVRAESGKQGGSVSGFNGEGGEGIGTKGVGEGAGTAGQNGTGQQGSDVYRVGVEEMPEAYGGVPAIVSKIPANSPDYENARGKNIYVLAFVDESGIVRKVHVSKGLGGAIDNLAANAVRKTRFRPGKDKGKVVKVQIMLNLQL